MSAAQTLTFAGPDGQERTVKLSNPDKPVWPATDDTPEITKRDLVDYLLAVEEPFLRAVGDRPVTLQRFRGGVEGEEFYSKNPPKGVPAWFRTTSCTYPSGRVHPQLVIDEIAAAVWAVQMSTVTFHPWPVRSDDNDLVDELRIDLDPQPGRGFTDAVEAAGVLRELMVELDLTPWVKTSGNRGVHVYARLHRTHEFQDVRHGVIGIARELERRLPDLVTTAWWKEERGERIFVDFNQANRDRTIASAYSPRPLPAAPVSMPVSWDDLPAVQPGQFTVRTVPEIVADRGDAWAGMDDGAAAGDILPALALWEADLERGLGELNFPPDYPKMRGEPPRVQPSKKNAANWEADGTTPRS
ncbi:MAG: ATP-dependent DNA ligase [Mobilicoccus sp.]|nr:ATP-dependent DNA ligase [Mobilicoccus sp.]